MNKFWKWMKEKEYNEHGSLAKYDCYFEPMNKENEPTKQMLIGYMIEYLISHKIKVKEMMPVHLPLDIDGVYNWTKEKIEELA